MAATHPDAAPPERLDAPTQTRPLLIDVRDLAVSFKVDGGVVEAVKKVAFQLHHGETIAIVGESGSGKSVTARAVMGLLSRRATVKPQSRIFLDGKDILAFPPLERRKLRGGRLAMIFQEPMSSLNPVYTIGSQIAEAIRIHQRMSAKAALARARELLEEVRIPQPEARLRQYPHQLSGGQRQRVMIAMALANRPDVLIADEPTTALDVTVQAQILSLLAELRQRLGLAMLFVSHDLAVVSRISHRIAVMYAGRIV